MGSARSSALLKFMLCVRKARQRPPHEAPESLKGSARAQVLCSGILTGVFIWFFFSFISVALVGLAGMAACLAPAVVTHASMAL